MRVAETETVTEINRVCMAQPWLMLPSGPTWVLHNAMQGILNGGGRMDAHGVEFHNVMEQVRPHIGRSYTRSRNMYGQWVWCPVLCLPVQGVNGWGMKQHIEAHLA